MKVKRARALESTNPEKKTNQINHFIFSLHNEQQKNVKNDENWKLQKSTSFEFTQRGKFAKFNAKTYFFRFYFSNNFRCCTFWVVFFFNACRVIFRFGFNFVQRFPALPFSHKRSTGRRERFSLALAERASKIKLKRLRSKRSRGRKKSNQRARERQ